MGEDGVAGWAVSILPAPLGTATSILCLLPAIAEPLEHPTLQHRRLRSRDEGRALAWAVSPGLGLNWVSLSPG